MYKSQIIAAAIATINRHLATLGLLPRTSDVSDVDTPASVAPSPALIVSRVVPSVPKVALPPAPVMPNVVSRVTSIAPPPSPAVPNVGSVSQLRLIQQLDR